MEYYTGIDVSLEVSHFCVVDSAGKIVKEVRVASEPEAILAWFAGLGLEMEAIGLEAGPLLQWLYAAMTEVGLPVVLLETRQVRDAFRSMPVKTDRKDARAPSAIRRAATIARSSSFLAMLLYLRPASSNGGRNASWRGANAGRKSGACMSIHLFCCHGVSVRPCQQKVE